MKPNGQVEMIDKSDDIDENVDEYALPCAEAVMAGTLALMTGYARCGCAVHRQMMAEKAAANLLALAENSSLSMQLSRGFRAIVFKLHSQWLELVEAERPVHGCSNADAAAQANLSLAEQSRALWHTTPEAIQ